MPSHTPKQAKVMSAISHGWRPSNLHIPVSVAKEFHEADKGKKWGAGRAEGGRIPSEILKDLAGGRLAYLMSNKAYNTPIRASQEREAEAISRAVPRAEGGRADEDRERNHLAGLAMLRFGMGSPLAEAFQRYQAQNIERAVPRRAYAAGGIPTAPWYERGAMYRLNRTASGFLHSGVPGRTDKLNLNVAPGSYVIPAETVSALGQSNSLAGGKVLDRLFNKGGGPRGANLALKGRARMGRQFMSGFAEGGEAGEEEEDVPIMAAGGEYVLSPEQVAEIGEGDMDTGHRILDDFVMGVRDWHLKTIQGLPRPKR